VALVLKQKKTFRALSGMTMGSPYKASGNHAFTFLLFCTFHTFRTVQNFFEKVQTQNYILLKGNID